MRKIILCVLFVLSPCIWAWQGIDDWGDPVDLEKKYVRPGTEIQVHDQRKGYIEVDVEAVRKLPNGRYEIEIYDPRREETRTLEMEDDGEEDDE
ncbi:hypothetical protein FACS189475_08580 [Betaproteobacteria bacterium]|nr:hypothetical protein FACS189475_08580 [Betaproteobacteria bacterium]